MNKNAIRRRRRGSGGSLSGILFSASEPGFTFEPWDITTLYQDRAGTTPVTAAGQSVGLRLDKSQGLQLGPERITNGDFSSGATGWSVAGNDATHVATFSGGTLRFQSDTTSPQLIISQGGVLTIGKTYLVEIVTSTWVSGSVKTDQFGTVVLSTGVGTTRFRITASSTVFSITRNSTNVDLTIDSISVREIAGNHQVAVSDAKRGVYGWMPKTGKRNLLTYTEQFDNAVWTKDGTTVTANAVTAPDGTLTADTVSTGTSTGEHRIYQTAGSSAVHTHTIYAKAGTANFVSLSTGNATYYAVFNLSTGAVSSSVSCTPSIVSVGDGWYRLTVTGSVAMPSFFFVVNVGETAASAVPATGSTGTSKTVHLWGAQLELGSTATAYQRVVSQYDITEAGVPTCYYVQADGVDDAYVTPTITPNTDKVQVFAGVRKLSDSPQGHILGGNGNNSGQFETLSGGWMTAANRYGAGFFTDAVLQIDSPASFTPPRSDVLSWRFDTAGATGADKVKLNVSGISQTLSISGVPAQGNFGAFAHYIYSRAGTLLPFNGLDFGHAVRFGPNLDAATIARVESLIARNTPEVTL